MKKYYEILEVHPKASREVIKKAHQVLVKKYHPDLYEGEEKINAEQRVKDINEAYKILSDEFLREQYDIELEKENKTDRLYNQPKKISNSTKEIKRTKKNNEEEYEEKKATKKKSAEKKQVKNYKLGSFRGLLEVIKPLFQNKPSFEKLKNLEREDYIAAGLTLVIMLILGVILWFIPATNGFVRSILPFV